MNKDHLALCSSPEWAAHLQTAVLPALAAGVELGERMLEIGPGPGAATEWLRHRVARLVAVESDSDAAALLRVKYAEANVEVVTANATTIAFPNDSFDSAASFTMLHHVPTLQLQNKVLAEVFRLLRPGGVLIGSDSIASNALHHFHQGDTYNPVEAATLLTRLQTLGYARIAVTVDAVLTFVAYKPAEVAGAPSLGQSAIV